VDTSLLLDLARGAHRRWSPIQSGRFDRANPLKAGRRHGLYLGHHLPGEQSAVNDVLATGYECRVVRGQEGGQRGDLVGPADARQWQARVKSAGVDRCDGVAPAYRGVDTLLLKHVEALRVVALTMDGSDL
jgi:hypothetical protein